MTVRYLPLLVAIAAVAGCGDSSDLCGPGTTAIRGICMPPDAGVVVTCGSGTIETGGVCVFDPSQCHDGTVYIAGLGCVDPARGLPIDVEEAAEPNGEVGGDAFVQDPGTGEFLETNATAPAGTIAVKPIGMTAVIHGHLAPFQDLDHDNLPDADADAYALTVAGPTLLAVVVAGVDGVDGGLDAIEIPAGSNDPLAGYQRRMINIAADTAAREMFLPAAGTYGIAVVDSRTLALGGAYGGSAAEYYLSIQQLALPAATAVAVDDNGHASTTADTLAPDQVAVYAVAMGLGFNDVQVRSTQPGSVFDPDFAILDDGGFVARAHATGATAAEATLAGFHAGDTTLIVVDAIENLVGPGASYDAEIQTTVNAMAFCATDCTIAPVAAQESEATTAPPIDPVTGALVPSQLPLLNTWFYDTTATPESDGFALTFSRPVDGVLFDASLDVVAAFTRFGGDTIAGYTGQIRVATPGRYYFVAYDPTGSAGTTTLTATTQIAAQTATALAFGTQTAPLGNPFNSALVGYAADPTTNPWESFSAQSAQSAQSGDVTAHAFDPATAFGRLDAVVEDQTATGGGASVAVAGDAAQLYQLVLPATGAGVGRILLDDPVSTYLITTNAANPGASFQLTVGPRAFVDLGTQDTATAQLQAEQTGNGVATRFLVRTAPGNLMQTSITTAATSGQVAPEVQLAGLDDDEAIVTTAGVAGSASAELPAHAGGWVAFAVTTSGLGSATGSAVGTYDVSISAAPEVGYASASVAATLVELTTGAGAGAACANGATAVSFDADGLSAPIAAPAGFEFFGATVGTFVVATNGFLSFDDELTAASAVAVALPSPAAPGALVAPLWDDLRDVVACTAIAGAAMTVEWVGDDVRGDPVEVEAQLDATDQTITFAYAAANGDLGATAAAGIQDFAGLTAEQLSFDHDFLTAGTPAAFRFTPR